MSGSAADTTSRRWGLPHNVVLLGTASLLNDVASEIIFPLLPLFLTQQLGGRTLHVGALEGLADTVASFLKLWSGAWADRVGKRKGLVVAGYAIAALSRPLIGLAAAPWQVIVARIGDRFGKGLRAAPRDALIADSTPREIHGAAFGFHRAMDHLGAAIGPLLATAFLLCWPDELRTLFLLTLIPGLAVTALVAWGLREAPRRSAVKSAPFRFSLRPFDRGFRLYLVALLVFTLGNSSDAFLLLRAGELGVATELLPLLWLAFHIVKGVGNVLSGRLADRLGTQPLILGGWLVYAVVYCLFGLATTAWEAWALFLIYGVFYALTEPAEKKFVAQLAPTESLGLAFGWFNFTLGVAALPANLLFGWVYQEMGALPAFGMGAGLAGLAAFLLILIAPRTRPGAAAAS